jgi:hypothetical protein
LGGDSDDLPFHIELWDDVDSGIEKLPALADFASACAEAVKRRPGKLITPRQKAR